MSSFQSLFGVPAETIQSTCILTPFLPKALRTALALPPLKNGNPYATAQGNRFSLIRTQIGAPYVGDAVLYLKETRCKNIIFVGACGALPSVGLTIGNLIVPADALALESFCQLLTHSSLHPLKITANASMHQQFIEMTPTLLARPMHAASLGSIHLETNYISYLKDYHIDVVDMECAAFLHAATSIHRPAIALLYITDILSQTSPFDITQHTTLINTTLNTISKVLFKWLSLSDPAK